MKISDETEGNTRYSIKIKFDKFIKNQTYLGLDKVAMNASFQDSTYLKEFLSYDMFRFLGAPGCLTNFIWVTIDGEPYGLFIGIESVDESYLKRNFGNDWDKGSLYKPFVVMYEDKEANYPDLVYEGDDFELYDYLFENAETDITDVDKRRVIESLKQISENKALEEVVDIESNIAYFIANNFVANPDAYPSHHPNNYFLWDLNGKLKMIPWDYNTAFGVCSEYSSTYNTSMIVNQNILEYVGLLDNNEKIPMWDMLLQEPYQTQYVETYSKFIEDYFDSGYYDELITKTYEMIRPYVKDDPTAYFGYEQFLSGYNTLRQMIDIRVQSVKQQIEAFNNNTPFTPIEVKDVRMCELGWKYFGLQKNNLE